MRPEYTTAMSLAQFIDDDDYERARVAYDAWALLTLLDGARKMPDSTIRSWDRLPGHEQRYIWEMFRVAKWDELRPSQREAWAWAMKHAFGK